jgi:hypothetical protein
MDKMRDRSRFPSSFEMLPVRLTTLEVLNLARFSAQTLRRRQKLGRFPRAIPGEKGIYSKEEVFLALGLDSEMSDSSCDKIDEAADAFHRDRAASQRRKADAG